MESKRPGEAAISQWSPEAIPRLEMSLQLQLDWIRAVDSKTPVIIGLATTMLAVTGAISPGPQAMTIGTALLAGAASIPALVSIGWCAAATFPQTAGPDGSLVFFGGISSTPLRAYTNKLRERTDADYFDDLSAQCHRNAQIAAAKYRAIRHAMIWLFAGTMSWLVCGYLLYKG